MIATVVSVTDGDTLVIDLEGHQDRVRLIGIDTPESRECLATEARATLASLVGGREVVLEREVDDRDDFDRLLRHVFVGEVYVNAVQVSAGLATARPVEPNTARSQEIQIAEDRARALGLGMWSGTACGPGSGEPLLISHIEYDAPGDDSLNLNSEWVEIRNDGTRRVSLAGWTLKDNSASHRYRFPANFWLDGGAAVSVYTGCGEDNKVELYWCESGSAVWNNEGDTAYLLDTNGNIAASRSYSR